MKNFEERYPDGTVEIFSDEKIFAEGFLKISEYLPETVKLRYKKYSLRITGDMLHISDMYEKSVTVTGKILTLEFERSEKIEN